ncbi:MAG TPA: cytochrome c oxidase assembly protein [Pararobbsia sp.]|jgi:cytochrome c oxidase assembly protein subunit 11|nr:cytochrome c oxidase assembly protein [Pararobbsia sp.]
MTVSNDRWLAPKLLGLCAAMFAFGFAMAPLYDVFCKVTGTGGKTSATADRAPAAVDPARTVRVEFLASVPRGSPWEFAPVVAHLDVHPGQLYEAHYAARNRTDEALVAQAVPSIAPGEAAKYFKKTECFCFTTQAFGADESRDLELIFTIDPQLPTYIDTVSLGYTMYEINP